MVHSDQREPHILSLVGFTGILSYIIYVYTYKEYMCVHADVCIVIVPKELISSGTLVIKYEIHEPPKSHPKTLYRSIP